VNVRRVDPRDFESEGQAVYRVYLWSDHRGCCEEFELTDARDIRAVLAWIDHNANGREVEAMVVVDGSAIYLIGPLDHASPT
jgi:hypothetical protein